VHTTGVREHGQSEGLRHPRHAQGLTIALGPRHAESPIELLLGRAPLLMADHRHGSAVEAREAGHDGRVVGEEPIAV
jgi:hypothetical protein